MFCNTWMAAAVISFFSWIKFGQERNCLIFQLSFAQEVKANCNEGVTAGKRLTNERHILTGSRHAISVINVFHTLWSGSLTIVLEFTAIKSCSAVHILNSSVSQCKETLKMSAFQYLIYVSKMFICTATLFQHCLNLVRHQRNDNH